MPLRSSLSHSPVHPNHGLGNGSERGHDLGPLEKVPHDLLVLREVQHDEEGEVLDTVVGPTGGAGGILKGKKEGLHDGSLSDEGRGLRRANDGANNERSDKLDKQV